MLFVKKNDEPHYKPKQQFLAINGLEQTITLPALRIRTKKSKV